MAAILEFALEKTEVAVDSTVFLELKNYVLFTVRNGLLVLGLAWVKVFAHDNLEAPRLLNPWVLGVHLVPELFSDDIFDSCIWLVLITAQLFGIDLERLKIHVHINELRSIAALVFVAMVMTMTLVVLVAAHMFLTPVGRLLNLLVKLLSFWVYFIDILIMETVIVDSACAGIHFNVFVDMSCLWIELKTIVLHEGKVWKLDVRDELVLNLVLWWSMSFIK